MTSFRKKDANKRNAAKSTGPKTLTEWKDMNLDAALMAEFLQGHAETFSRPLPELPGPPEGTKVIADPRQKQMLLKLIDLQAQHLSDLGQINSEDSRIREMSTNEFAPRYFATARRDLHCAVDWYLLLREKGL